MTNSTTSKRLTGFDDKNHFYRANRDLSCVLKTENILEYMFDPLLRQLARDVTYGKRGKACVAFTDDSGLIKQLQLS